MLLVHDVLNMLQATRVSKLLRKPRELARRLRLGLRDDRVLAVALGHCPAPLLFLGSSFHHFLDLVLHVPSLDPA